MWVVVAMRTSLCLVAKGRLRRASWGPSSAKPPSVSRSRPCAPPLPPRPCPTYVAEESEGERREGEGKGSCGAEENAQERRAERRMREEACGKEKKRKKKKEEACAASGAGVREEGGLKEKSFCAMASSGRVLRYPNSGN